MMAKKLNNSCIVLATIPNNMMVEIIGFQVIINCENIVEKK